MSRFGLIFGVVRVYGGRRVPGFFGVVWSFSGVPRLPEFFGLGLGTVWFLD